MSSLKADFLLEEKVNLQRANSEPKSVPPPSFINSLQCNNITCFYSFYISYIY